MKHTRIAALGNSGSGKSTLAGLLARQIPAPLLDLDTVAWEPGKVAVARDSAEAVADVTAFCRGTERWIIEGCYADLVTATLQFSPLLLFLNPGEAQCIANCQARPWEQHKYASREEQDSKLQYLLGWVREYYTRDGVMSLKAHRACFDGYTGPKRELTSQPGLGVTLAELLR